MSFLKLLFTHEFSIERKSQYEKDIVKLENQIIDYNNSLLSGELKVDDVTYNNCVELLSLLNPTSPLLKNDDKRIIFIKEYSDEIVKMLEEETKDMETLQFYVNPQGFNVRLQYEDGELCKAVTFGRTLHNQDVTDLMIDILGNRNDNMTDFGSVIIDGCLILPTDNIPMVLNYNIPELEEIENSYIGLFKILSYNSDNPGELGNLDDLVYFMATDIQLDSLPIPSISDRYSELERLGFERPDFIEVEKEGNLILNIEYALSQMEETHSNYNYISDGIRLLLNNDKVVLLKKGSWEITVQHGIVEEINWGILREMKVPILRFREPILLPNGKSISELKLRNINLLLILNIQEGKEFSFAYFGSFGILPLRNNDEIIFLKI